MTPLETGSTVKDLGPSPEVEMPQAMHLDPWQIDYPRMSNGSRGPRRAGPYKMSFCSPC